RAGRLRDLAAGSDDGGARASVEGRADERVAVGPIAGQRDEQVAGPNRSAVDGDASDGRRRGRPNRAPLDPPADRRRHLDHGPGPHDVPLASAPNSASISSRATTRSSNGTVRSENCCPVSWPLPAITT